MSDAKPKLILRPGANIAEKSPSPATKLMLSHGKPNFTITRSKSKVEPQTPPTPEASQIVLKSTTFNGAIKPSKIKTSTENEVNKVVLRRTKLPEAYEKSAQDDDEPEFVKAQRKIAERLAKESNLDFENRKSGYFTHVMMSPTSPTKTFELPVVESGKIQKATVLDAADLKSVTPTENGQAKIEEPQPTPVQNGANPNEEVVETVTTNGKAEPEPEPEPHSEQEREAEVVQVAKALIAEVLPEEISVPNGLTNGNSESKENGHAENPTPAPQSDVNFELKTVTSFSKELSSEPNNYPDTVKITQQVESDSKHSELIQEMSKLKFDITADSEDVNVTPVLRTEE